MLTLKFQNGKRKLDERDSVRFLNGDKMLVGEIINEITLVYEMFLGNKNFEFKVFINWTNTRARSRTGGFVKPFFSYGEMYTQKYYSYNDFIQNFYHEFGHIYHHMTDTVDFYNRTPYGRELYAEEFAAMVMGSLYNTDCATCYEYYNGYRNKQVYNKPLTEK